MLVPAHREMSSVGSEPAYQPLVSKAIYDHWGPLPKIDYYSLNLSCPPRDTKKCHATGVEEDPKVTQDIQCLRRGGGVALIRLNNNFLNRRGSGGARAITTRTG